MLHIPIQVPRKVCEATKKRPVLISLQSISKLHWKGTLSGGRGRRSAGPLLAALEMNLVHAGRAMQHAGVNARLLPGRVPCVPDERPSLRATLKATAFVHRIVV